MTANGPRPRQQLIDAFNAVDTQRAQETTDEGIRFRNIQQGLSDASTEIRSILGDALLKIHNRQHS
ncbi:hypothetical protein COU78_00105 [Candidatus Peregrinibacteria bacterium CG10_big_fil_rev_8_21_14_0_10_49_24]|nr:MAG: hypothetical protein COV83_06150 [Candidatus Peregrinibacteria bacterium CG11_big_fil_rev_8_21_14_0_20_49_14]PIR51591.1 MAG: hypothetical protein COU78_00105 [Candidatus Peregrinibacteria bacterium CG10_big_fil_rev_8_21_14_0_10_49_24]PJA68047.1 MAG: hypothetical protein CO157_01860 [Candidatus Peregrinibacteria bacterium CG_4_9_14_3_um_filter_49_12]